MRGTQARLAAALRSSLGSPPARFCESACGSLVCSFLGCFWFALLGNCWGRAACGRAPIIIILQLCTFISSTTAVTGLQPHPALPAAPCLSFPPGQALPSAAQRGALAVARRCGAGVTDAAGTQRPNRRLCQPLGGSRFVCGVGWGWVVLDCICAVDGAASGVGHQSGRKCLFALVIVGVPGCGAECNAQGC